MIDVSLVGSVTIVDLAGDGGPGGGCTFEAHSNAIAFLRFSRDNRLLATASVRGTLVRVWDVEVGRLMMVVGWFGGGWLVRWWLVGSVVVGWFGDGWLVR